MSNMSSTRSTYFQAPAHTLAHMENYPEMGSQQPYSDHGFGSQLIDYGFPGPADANIYSAPVENLYDGAGYNRLPPGIGLFDFEDVGPQASGVVQYDKTQDTNHASPELLCPKPTLPSRFSPQFSWSNWPSEAPINVHRTHLEPSSQQFTHTNPIPHSPEVTEIRYPFETQPALEFREPASNPISMPHHHRDSGYIHQPFVAPVPPSFERGPSQSTHLMDIQPRYHAAHQPILPEQRSSHSELAPNLIFMNSQAPPPVVRQEKIHTQEHYTWKNLGKNTITRSTTPSRDVKKNPFALGLNGPPLTAIGRKLPPPLPLNRVARSNRDPVVSDHVMAKTTASKAVIRNRSSRNVNEPRRPSLACTFCRERKIACGRPPDGSPDPTCNQCARRSFTTCQYLDSKSTSKEPSPPLKRK